MIIFTNNAERGKSALIHFGEGRILIDPLVNRDGSGWVLLDELVDSLPVGADVRVTDDYEVTGNCVYLRFENIESLDVLIKKLSSLRLQMAREKWEFN